MLDAGGVNVIQAFYSVDVTEEAQTWKRTARKGVKRSYSWVQMTLSGGDFLFAFIINHSFGL